MTQFDSPATRATTATPTCGGCCCCCCCCVATIIGASGFTAASAQAELRKAAADDPSRSRWSSPWPGVLGALALPLALVTLVAAVGAGAPALVFAVAAWFGLVGLAYWGAGSQGPWLRALGVVGVGLVAFAIEFFVALAAFTGSGATTAYLVTALALGIGVAVMSVMALRQ